MLISMNELVVKYIDVDTYGNWLVKALLQLIEEDETIPGDAYFYVNTVEVNEKLYLVYLRLSCKKQRKFTKATVVDYMVPHRGDKALFWDRSNWQALCKRCHDRKTMHEDMHPVYHF